MSAALLVGRHVLQESIRRRVFAVFLTSGRSAGTPSVDFCSR